jgi:hypothetical protein
VGPSSIELALPLVMGPPKCKCGKKRTELLSLWLRTRWSDDRGIKWDWHSVTQAYWFYCEGCHMAIWMSDRRCRNGAVFQKEPPKNPLRRPCGPGVAPIFQKEPPKRSLRRLPGGSFPERTSKESLKAPLWARGKAIPRRNSPPRAPPRPL